LLIEGDVTVEKEPLWADRKNGTSHVVDDSV
jgi:hypothetical protein